MQPDQKAFRIGALVLIGAVFLRLLSSTLDTAAQSLPQTEIARYLLFMQTGRFVEADVLQFSDTSPTPEATEPPTPIEPRPTALTFTQEDASLVEFRNTTNLSLDAGAYLVQPLDWELTGDSPTVLILHTHGTESYSGTEGYRSLDDSQNMLSIGDRLAARLEEQGVTVLHDRTLHDEISYNGSYTLARQTIEQYLEQYPSIQLVLDIHRDAAEDANGNQINYTATTPEGEAAKLMLVMGTDAGGLSHPAWQENMALAVKLQVTLEKICPGICRPIYVRTSRFNQDLSPGALLIEVGAAGNSQQEALLAADTLAQGIVALANGADLAQDITKDSAS